MINLLLPLALLGRAQANELSLFVDAREAPRDLYHVVEKIPVKPGQLNLVYPKWIPGEHSPDGPLNSVFDFFLEANGKVLTWERDPLDLYTIHATVPEGCNELTVNFNQSGKSADVEQSTVNLARIKWNRLLWYPMAPSDSLLVRAQIQIPAGWEISLALPEALRNGDTISYAPVTLTKLVDSPAQIGKYFRRVDLSGKSTIKHRLNVMADSAKAISPLDTEEGATWLKGVRRIQEEARAMTGTEHYEHYDWLLTLSDEGGSEGLEHHESSEDGVGENALSDEAEKFDLADLLSHEYFHSFNGKFRRPEGLCTPEYQTPMKDDLLWVYEGMTQFFGKVLPTRSGLWSQEQFREELANIYDELAQRKGRNWRPLVDTATSASILYTSKPAWLNARRSVDYYDEMVLVWLEVDQKIRSLTGQRKSINDFSKLFHGGADKGIELKPYTFDDVVATLNQVAPYAWAGLLRDRIYHVQPIPTMEGIRASGWMVTYTTEPNIAISFAETRNKEISLRSSLGIVVNEDSTVSDIVQGSAADQAGISPGVKLVAVNGRKFDGERLKEAVADTAHGAPLEITYEKHQFQKTVRLDYTQGLLYPHLVPIKGQQDHLKDLLRPLVKE